MNVYVTELKINMNEIVFYVTSTEGIKRCY